MPVKISILAVFFLIIVAVGVYARKKAVDVSGFVLGGRNIGAWMTAFAYGTTYFSAVIFVGYAGQFGFKFGLSATWIGLANALVGSLLAWVVLGRRTRVMTHHLATTTMPEYFMRRYDSKALKITASAIIFIFLVPYTASVYNGLSLLFEMAFGIPYVWCVLLMATLTAIYVVLGGYVATAINDVVQGCIMLAGITAVILAVLKQNGGFFHAVVQLSQQESDLAITAGQQGAFASFFGPDPLSLLSVMILTSLGAWGMPQMVHKFYAIKNDKAVYTGTIISTLFATVVAGGSYFLGGFARLYDVPAIYRANGSVAYDSIVPLMLSNLSDILIGMVVVLVFSASMSTLASLVLVSSSSLTLDFLDGTVVKRMSEKAKISCMRWLVVAFIAISVLLAIKPPMFIAQLMGISWGALAGSFLAPFLYGLYWKRATLGGVWASFITGVGITVTNLLFGYIGSPITAGAVTMLVGLAITPLVSLLTPKLKAKHVADVFRCYE